MSSWMYESQNLLFSTAHVDRDETATRITHNNQPTLFHVQQCCDIYLLWNDELKLWTYSNHDTAVRHYKHSPTKTKVKQMSIPPPNQMHTAHSWRLQPSDIRSSAAFSQNFLIIEVRIVQKSIQLMQYVCCCIVPTAKYTGIFIMCSSKSSNDAKTSIFDVRLWK